jgi:alpha-L-fucosidase
MKRTISAIVMAVFLCGFGSHVLAADKHPNMDDYNWWRKARFGVFIHWGPSSVLAQGGGSWQRANNPRGKEASRNSTTPGHLPEAMTKPGWQKKYYGKYGAQVPQDIYDNLYQVFNPKEFDADEWAQTFKESGVNYIVFTSKHHDGFCMFDAPGTDYDIMNTPFKRDICKELSDACHKVGIKVLWYYSKPDWYDPRYDPANSKPYEDYMVSHIASLASNYGEIKGFWWDGGNKVHVDGKRVYHAIYDNQPGAIYNGRGGMNMPGVKFATPEQKLGSFNRGWPWESCVTMQGEGWFWNGGNNIMWPESCIRLLINAAVGDGNLLLDFGPTDKGAIYGPIKKNYLSMGKWLKKYGESIYGTRGGPYKPGTWGGATCSGNNIYLHITQVWPGGVLNLPALPAKITSVTVLTGGKADVTQTDKGLTVKLDPKDHAVPDTVIKLTIDQAAEENDPFASENALFVSLNASAMASSHIKSWKGLPGSVTLQDFEVKMPKTKYFGEDSEPTAKPESNHKFKPTEEMVKKYPWIKTRRDHIWRYWMADPSDKTPWLAIDFGKVKEFNKITMLEKYNRIKSYRLEYEKDGNWVELYKGGRLDSLALALPQPIKAQKVRITITDWESDYKNEGPGLREFDFWFDSSNK